MNTSMTIKYLLLISLLLTSYGLFSQDRKTPLTTSQPAETLDLNKLPVDTATLDMDIKNVQEKIKKEKETNPLVTTELMSLASNFDFYAKHPRIEKDTKIYSTWYKNIADTLKKMANSKQDMMVATMNKNIKMAEKSKLLYKEQSETLLTLLDNPQKIPPGSRK